MENIEKQLINFFNNEINIPENYINMINNTLKNIEHKKENIIIKILKMIIILITTIIGMSGLCFAGVKIYNERIKEQASINSRGLFDTGNGITGYETDLTQNDMKWYDEIGIYYKIITNIEDYQKYKSRVQELPNMEKKDFETTFLVILSEGYMKGPHNKDLIISDIKADKTTTNIIMKQKENPNYDIEQNIWYAIADNSQLRKKVAIHIENEKFINKNAENIKKLPKNYSIEDAKKDGCYTLKNNKIVSKNKNQMEEFIEKTEKGQNESLRIYSKFDNQITIEDINFIDGIYYNIQK